MAPKWMNEGWWKRKLLSLGWVEHPDPAFLDWFLGGGRYSLNYFTAPPFHHLGWVHMEIVYGGCSSSFEVVEKFSGADEVGIEEAVHILSVLGSGDESQMPLLAGYPAVKNLLTSWGRDGLPPAFAVGRPHTEILHGGRS